MNASAQQMACPRCNGALAPGAQFCGACGSPVGPAAAAPQPPPAYAPPPGQAPPPPMPNIGAMARGFSPSSAGNSKQVQIAAAPAEAFAAAMAALSAEGADVHWSQPPQGARFLLTRKSAWSTMGFPIKYDGELQIGAAGPGQSVVRLSLKLRWGSAGILFLTQAAFAFVASMFNLYVAYYFFFFLLVILGATAWTVSSQLPDKALKDLAEKMSRGAGAGYSPAVAAPAPAPAAPAPAAPTPAPAAPPPAPQAPAARSDSAAIMEQLKQLGALQAAGVLTAAEFEAKKAELLSRL